MNTPLPRPLLGIAMALGATAAFAGLDTLTQMLAGTASVAMMLSFRYLVQTVFSVALDGPRRGRALLRSQHHGLQLARGLALALTNLLAVLSLMHIPVGEYTAIVMLTPVGIALVSALAWGEHVSPWRWLLMAGGFAGAVLVVRPAGDDFQWALLLPVGTLLASVTFQLLTARLAGVDEPGTTNFYTAAIGSLLSALALAATGWQTLDAATWGLMALVAACNCGGHYLLILAYGRAPATTVAPFLYFQIGFAALAGWALLGQTPDRWVLAGITLITVCGVLGRPPQPR